MSNDGQQGTMSTRSTKGYTIKKGKWAHNKERDKRKQIIK